jgi:membrane associated rhomboid family serine protease
MVLLKEEDFAAGEADGDGEVEGEGPVLLRSKKGLKCPACDEGLAPVDYQYTGNAVYHCGKCSGTFAPKNSAGNIHRQLVAGQEKAGKLLEKTKDIEDKESRGSGFAHLSRRSGDEHFFLPIPAVIPVESEVKLGIIPYVTFSVIAIFLLFFLAGKVFFAGSKDVAGGVALVSGAGLGNPIKILGYGLFHTHLLPLIVNGAFLFIAGSPLEERLSPAKFVLLFFAGLITCGAVHLLSGQPGGQILGASGGISAILGGYVVLFPLMKVRVFAMGYLLSLPSYLMVIAWLLISFFMTGDFISAYLNPYGPGFVPVSAAFLTGLVITAGLKMATIE